MDSAATPEALTVAAAARRLGVHRQTIYRRIADGTIPAARLGRRVIVPLWAIEALLSGPPPEARRGA